MLAVVSVCGIIFSLYKVTAILLFSVLIVFYADFNLLKNKKYVKAIVWCVILDNCFYIFLILEQIKIRIKYYQYTKK